MIEPDNRPSETEEVCLEGGVVSHEYGCSVEDQCRICDKLYASILHLRRLPEVSDGGIAGVVVSDDVPPITPPPNDDVEKILEVIAEGRGRFWYAGELCIIVKGHGHCGWLYLTPQPGVPRIKTWRTDDEGRLVRVPSEPTVGGFLVRYEESEASVVSWASAVEPISN